MGDIFPDRVAKNQFLQTDQVRVLRRMELQGTRAKAANRPRCDLDRPDSALVDAKFGMHRPMRQTDGAHRFCSSKTNRLLLRGGKARGRDVNRFLEKRSFQWIGLVKNGQELERTIDENSFHSYFSSWNVFFGQ